MAAGEAILFINAKLGEDFDYRCKQAGQLASKTCFLSAPSVGMFETGAWLRNAAHGNACAGRLATQLGGLSGIEILFPVEANAVFVRMSDARLVALRDRGWRFYTARPASCLRGIPRRNASTIWQAISAKLRQAWMRVECAT